MPRLPGTLVSTKPLQPTKRIGCTGYLQSGHELGDRGATALTFIMAMYWLEHRGLCSRPRPPRTSRHSSWEESKCCPVFSFEIDEIDQGLRLGIRTPPGGEAMLEVLQAAFAGNPAKLRAKFETIP
jgi:hypothetical protein